MSIEKSLSVGVLTSAFGRLDPLVPENEVDCLLHGPVHNHLHLKGERQRERERERERPRERERGRERVLRRDFQGVREGGVIGSTDGHHHRSLGVGVGSEGLRRRWGTPTMTLYIRIHRE